MEETNQQPERDKDLWRMAKKRAAFKSHLYSYLAVNIFLWLLWAFTDDGDKNSLLPWPAWVSLGWGLGLALDFFNTYFGDKVDMTEREYEKLKRKKEGR